MEDIYLKHTAFTKIFSDYNYESLLDRLGSKIESKAFINNLIETLYLCHNEMFDKKELYRELLGDILTVVEELDDEKVCKIKSMSVICISRIFSKHFTSLLCEDIGDVVKQIKPKLDLNFGKKVTIRVPRHGDLINNLYYQVRFPKIINT